MSWPSPCNPAEIRSVLSALPGDVISMVQGLVEAPRWMRIGGELTDEAPIAEFNLGDPLSKWKPWWISEPAALFAGQTQACMPRGQPLVFNSNVRLGDSFAPCMLHLHRSRRQWHCSTLRGLVPFIRTCASIGDTVYMVYHPSKPMHVFNIDHQVISTCGTNHVMIDGPIVAFDQKIIVAGHATDESSQNAACYDPVAIQWQSLPSLPLDLVDHTLTSQQNSMYVHGGWDPQLKAQSKAGYHFDPRQKEWHSIAPLTIPLARHASSTFDDNLVVMWGGFNATAEEASAACYAYDLRADQIYEKTEWGLSTPCHGHKVLCC